MKRVFLVYERLRNADGTVFTDAEGCHYLRPIAGVANKEFANPTEIFQTIIDHNNNPENEPFTGEILIVETFTF